MGKQLRKIASYSLDVLLPGKEYTMDEIIRLVKQSGATQSSLKITRSVQNHATRGKLDDDKRNNIHYYRLSDKGITTRPADVLKRMGQNISVPIPKGEAMSIGVDTMQHMIDGALPELVKRIKKLEQEVASLEVEVHNYWPKEAVAYSLTEDIASLIGADNA